MTTFPPSTFSKPSISFENVFKNQDFVILTLTVFDVSFNLIFMASGASMTVSSDPFGGLLVTLGASWGYLRKVLGAPLGILGVSWAAKRPRCLQEPPRPPRDLSKTSPRPPPEPSKTVPGTPKMPPNCSSTDNVKYFLVFVCTCTCTVPLFMLLVL